MRKALAVLSLAALALAAPSPASAHCYEVLNRVLDASDVCVSIPIDIYDASTAALVFSGFSADNCGTLSSNFRIDLNNNCTAPRLQPGTTYVVELHYADTTRSAYFERPQLECSPTNLDTSYDIRPLSSSAGIQQTSGDCLEEFWGYPDATLPVAVSLGIASTKLIGDKTVYTLRATASGGDGSYSFSWSNATAQSGSTENPNYAVRTILRQTTVSVTVTSAGGSASRSIVLRPGGIF